MCTICGANCSECFMNANCKGCKNTCGSPFGGSCIVAKCCIAKNQEYCKECEVCELKLSLLEEINSLEIEELPTITELYNLSGAFVNLEYTINGNKIKLLDDKNIYLGCQVEVDSKCYGIACDDKIIVVSSYDQNGENPSLILYKTR